MIRLTAIELQDFKNVGKGRIELSSVGFDSESWVSDIVGIYGQNGSGKTSVIQALCILKAIWSTGALPESCGDCVAVGCGSFAVSVDAVIAAEQDLPALTFTYHVRIAAAGEDPRVVEERLTYRTHLVARPSLKTAFHCGTGDNAVLKPRVAWDALFSLRKEFSVDMIVAQRLAACGGSSLLMSASFGSLLSDIGKEVASRQEAENMSKGAARAYGDVWVPTKYIRDQLLAFSIERLSVITSSRQAEPMLNVMRISTHEGEAGKGADAYFGIDLSSPAFVAEQYLPDLQATIKTISIVIAALVPGLSVEVESLGSAMGDDGEMGERVEVVATRGQVTVPLRAESEGIKKLVAILVLLVDVYAKPGCCIAIDELDSGVFEFLLGEILQVLQDHGRGQLVFTAHNLRPLETLDKTSLVFTTTNPQNRYVTFKGVKAASNLRNQYLRAINLGGQPETVYEATSKFEIDNAFYDASNPES